MVRGAVQDGMFGAWPPALDFLREHHPSDMQIKTAAMCCQERYIRRAQGANHLEYIMCSEIPG